MWAGAASIRHGRTFLMPLDRAVLEEASMDAAADGHHETTGKWTKPCNTWPFKWPFSPCKEPPGQASTAPTYEFVGAHYPEYPE